MEVLFCKIDGRVLEGMRLGVLEEGACGVLVEVLFGELDGRALEGMQFGVLVEVLFCESARGHAMAGC